MIWLYLMILFWRSYFITNFFLQNLICSAWSSFSEIISSLENFFHKEVKTFHFFTLHVTQHSFLVRNRNNLVFLFFFFRAMSYRGGGTTNAMIFSYATMNYDFVFRFCCINYHFKMILTVFFKVRKLREKIRITMYVCPIGALSTHLTALFFRQWLIVWKFSILYDCWTW